MQIDISPEREAPNPERVATGDWSEPTKWVMDRFNSLIIMELP
jgi:hypothetical protein